MALCKCGFEDRDIYLGVGRMTMEASAVCYCDKCEDVQQRVEYEFPKICDKCKNPLNPYSRFLGDDEVKEIDFTGGDNDSEGTFYHCPKCKNNTLKFHWIGIWD